MLILHFRGRAIVPLLLVFRESTALHIKYASFSDHPTVFLYSGMARSHDDSVAFCESMWMKPAILWSLEQAEQVMNAIVPLGAMAFIGASRDLDADMITWDDGTYFWPSDETDVVNEKDPWIYLISSSSGEVEWRDTSSKKGVLCEAESLDAIKGQIPVIVNLGSIGSNAIDRIAQARAALPSCSLTLEQRDAIHSVVGTWGTTSECIFNVTLGSIMDRR